MWEQLDKYKDLIATDSEGLGRWYGTAEQPFLYPSVTTILHETIHQPGLINWYKNNSANAIAGSAGGSGSGSDGTTSETGPRIGTSGGGVGRRCSQR